MPALERLGELGGWPAVLSKLFRREDLTSDEAAAVLDVIFAGEAEPSQIAAFASAIHTKGESADELLGLVRTMRAHGESIDLGPGVVDTCGTGGDRSGSVNVSSMASIIVAAAGARVCKHGGRASSSVCGSADVFEALGVVVDLDPAGVERCVSEVGIGFCLATRFHPAMRHAAAVRRDLGAATVFNFLGPLVNPARASRQLLGIGDPALIDAMLAVLEGNGAERVLAVYGHDGLDELSTVAPSTIVDSTAGTRRTYVVDSVDLGLARARPSDLLGGDAATNAAVMRAVLSGETGPYRDFALLNAAGAMVAAGLSDDLASGLVVAAKVVDGGQAAATLEALVRVSNEAAEAS